MPISALVHVRSDSMGLGGCESHTTFGVDFVSVGLAPEGECLRVDVRLDNDKPAPEHFLPSLVGSLLPVLESIGECMGVVRNGANPFVVLFSIPRDADATDLIHGRAPFGNG